ncbi:MAG TPA: cytochrome c oxidase assembly protein [Gammaproteobacteria bacterium]
MPEKPRHRNLVLKLAAMCAAMFAFGYALVPLYGVFCEITGLGGKTASAPQRVVEDVDASRTVRVEFVATSSAPFEFHPTVSHLDVHPGQLYRTEYYAANLTGTPLTVQAVPSVAPGIAAKHLKKVECFCFTAQDFAAHEGRGMPVVFMVSRDLPAHLDRLSLSYTLFVLSE